MAQNEQLDPSNQLLEKPEPNESEIGYENLSELDGWLKENWSTYRALIEGGSVAAGDPIDKKRSDWEIAIVADEISADEKAKLREFLSTFPEDNRVMFVLRTTNRLLENRNDLHQLTGKFRSKTLFGEDLTNRIPLPDRSVIESAWSNGLKKSITRIEKFAINSQWDDDQVRDEFRGVFKDIFMDLQIKAWYESGTFPVTRKDVVAHYQSEELEEMWKVMHNIDEADRQTILNLAEKVSIYILNKHLAEIKEE